MYFKSSGSTSAQGALDLTLGILHPLDSNTDSDSVATGFVIEHGDGGIQMAFNAGDAREREQWVHAIADASGGVVKVGELGWMFGDHVWATMQQHDTHGPPTLKAIMEETNEHRVGKTDAKADKKASHAHLAALEEDLGCTQDEIDALKRAQKAQGLLRGDTTESPETSRAGGGGH